MKAIKNWDKVQEASSGFEVLPVGGYVCEIKMAEEKSNKNNNGTHLEISFDVCEGDYRGFFAQDYKGQTREDKFWRGVIRQNIPLEGAEKYKKQCQFFKRFTTCLEKSNEGYTWDWHEERLKGKKIGVVFGEVERESARGIRYMVTMPQTIVTVEAVRTDDYKVPEPKMLGYAALPGTAPAAQNPFGSAIADDDTDLPF